MDLPAELLGAADAVLIAGPTASGKSRLALSIAGRAGRPAWVINADSMQVYSALRVLTARPSEAEERAVPHRLFGHVAPVRRYSAGEWLREARQILAEARDAGVLPIVVGGTGLYFRALEAGLAAIPSIPAAVREEIASLRASEGPEQLHRRLAARDPVAAATLRASDVQRVVRALEVVEATGKPISDWHETHPGRGVLEPGRVLRLVLAPARDALHARIDARFDAMMGAGALEEVRALRDMQLDPGLPVMRAIGVRELIGALEETRTLGEAVAAAKAASRQYAKRQETWFRNQMPDWERLEA